MVTSFFFFFFFLKKNMIVTLAILLYTVPIAGQLSVVAHLNYTDHIIHDPSDDSF